ncbi:hypothetical protein D9M71_233860 [compost metagenome]
MLDQLLQFLPAALANARQTPALLQEEGEEEQRQPGPAGGQAGTARAARGFLRGAQQVQRPAFAGQRQAFPEVVGTAAGPLDPGQPAALAEILQRTVDKWRQGLLVVLAGGGHFGTPRGGDGLQLAVAPARLVGDEHHATGVADQNEVRALAPFLFQLGEFQLHHDGADELVLAVAHRAGEEVAGNAADDANGVEAPAAVAAGFGEVGAEAVVVADETGGRVPVAGGYCQAVAVQQLEGGGAGGAVHLLQLEVELRLRTVIHRSFEDGAHFRVQCQHRGQGAEAVDQRAQGAGVERQLLSGLFAFVAQGLALGLAAGEVHRQEQPGEQQQDQRDDAQGTGNQGVKSMVRRRRR